MTHMHWVERQNKLELPNDEEEVNTRDIHKCDGQAHDPDTMTVPLTPKKTTLSSTKTWRAIDSFDLIYPSSAYAIDRYPISSRETLVW